MPYGISPAPKYFQQQKLEQNLQGLPGVFRIAVDLLITGQGDTKEDADKDHDANLVRLLQRCRERNIRLNKVKFDFKCQQVTFIGHLLSSQGVKPCLRLKTFQPQTLPGMYRNMCDWIYVTRDHLVKARQVVYSPKFR